MEVRGAFAAALVLAAAASAAQLPDSWPRCRRRDPDLDFCLRHAIQLVLPQLALGTPELEIPSLEPVPQKGEVTIERLPGRISLQLKLSKMEVQGISGIRVLSVFSDLDKGVIDMYLAVPVVQLNSFAEVEGTILHEPVSPQRGNANFTFYDASGFMVISGKTVERDGDEYFEVEKVRIAILSLRDLAVNFDQLDRNPKRSAKLNYLLNANIVPFWPEIRDHLQAAQSEEYRDLANLVFSKVPLKNIFLADDHPVVLKGPSTVLL